MRYIVITENQLPGNAQQLKPRILNPCGLTNPQIVAIVDKSDQQVTYDGETWCSYEKVYNT